MAVVPCMKLPLILLYSEHTYIDCCITFSDVAAVGVPFVCAVSVSVAVCRSSVCRHDYECGCPWSVCGSECTNHVQ